MQLFKKIAVVVSFFSVISQPFAASFDQLIGVDYQPNHFSADANTLNFHDVFYVGHNLSGKAVTNIYAELAQLKQAGFTTVRSYQTTVYSWVDIINQAHALGMKVVYEAVIPQQPADSIYPGCPVGGAQNYIPCAQATLNSVINIVTPAVFDSTVILVFAGHENYCNAGNSIPPCNGTSNVTYLMNAVTSLQATLSDASLTTPVSSALISGNLVTPDGAISVDMQQLISTYSADAPLAFDPYPFQWGVSPANEAVWTPPLATTPQLTNSLAWDYLQVVGSVNPPATPNTPAQPFYPAGRVLMAAETGWATTGSTAEYACNSPGPCAPSVANAVAYYQTLYQQNTSNFVTTSGYSIGVLAFEAYDEPSKGVSSAEGHYGLFDSNCNQKAAGMVPTNTMVTESGCQGFSSGALLTIVGFAHPYTLVISQKNPVTGKDASITMSSNGTQSTIPGAPWPEYLVFPGASITIRGNPSCTSKVEAIKNQKITFTGKCNCPSDGLNNCYF